jgi:hypothetical protein
MEKKNLTWLCIFGLLILGIGISENAIPWLASFGRFVPFVFFVVIGIIFFALFIFAFRNKYFGD